MQISEHSKNVVTQPHRNPSTLTQPLAASDLPDCDGLKMGSLTEVWKNGQEWLKFCSYLESHEPEGMDSSGSPLKLSRYARFLQLYVNLHYEEEKLRRTWDKSSETRLKVLVDDIKNHPEGFFDSERCLSCIDAGIRNKILANLKSLKLGRVKPGAWIYQPAYSPVLQKLDYLLGFYHDSNFVQEKTNTK